MAEILRFNSAIGELLDKETAGALLQASYDSCIRAIAEYPVDFLVKGAFDVARKRIEDGTINGGHNCFIEALQVKDKQLCETVQEMINNREIPEIEYTEEDYI